MWRNVEIFRLHIGTIWEIWCFGTSESGKPACVCGVSASIRTKRVDLSAVNEFDVFKFAIHFKIIGTETFAKWTYFKIELVLSIFVGRAMFKSAFLKNISLFLSLFSSRLIKACIVNCADVIFNSFISNFSEAGNKSTILNIRRPLRCSKNDLLLRNMSNVCFFHLPVSIGPSFLATLNRISAVQNSGTRTNSLPASTGKWKPNWCSNKINGSYARMLLCSAFHGTTGTDCFFTEQKKKHRTF